MAERLSKPIRVVPHWATNAVEAIKAVPGRVGLCPRGVDYAFSGLLFILSGDVTIGADAVKLLPHDFTR